MNIKNYNPVNFMAPCDKDIEAIKIIIRGWSMGFQYDQLYEQLTSTGFYLPLDQYNSIYSVLNIQTQLDIGYRQEHLTYIEE